MSRVMFACQEDQNCPPTICRRNALGILEKKCNDKNVISFTFEVKNYYVYDILNVCRI